MIALMNYAVPLIVLLGLVAAYATNKVWPVLLAVVISLVYTVAQPTYMPKGTVRPPVIQEFERVERPFVDRALKPMSDEERDARRNEQLKLIEQSIQSKIQKGE
ncbi:hypothetical protein [Pseudomonas phage vB_PseuGesM_254]|uniref:Uncharacterized protein n=1 Tax=Pseudomonas phage vB_PseuGesM_254 TaxID=3092638 RepID=A0AAX4G6J4_9CAUD|nr:hypothetical protein [Pseudomonas phage PseuGes_254]